MIDLVIPVRATPDDNQDLRYALRSVHQNLEYSGVVWLVGEKPSWVRGVQFIPSEQRSAYKTTNVLRAVRRTCKTASVTSRFILSNDDIFVMQKLSVARLNVTRGPISELVARWEAQGGIKGHARTVYRAGEYLKQRGYEDPLAYDSLHWPQVYDRSLLRVTLDECEKKRIKTWATVYGNYHRVGSRRVMNAKHNVARNWPKMPVLSTSDGEFASGELGELIRSKFPDPSPFEEV